MHCKIRHFAQSKIQCMREFFNTIDPEPTLAEVGNPIQHLEAGYTCAVVPYSQKKASLQTRRGPYTVIQTGTGEQENGQIVRRRAVRGE